MYPIRTHYGYSCGVTTSRTGRTARITGYVRPSIKKALKAAARKNRVSESVILDTVLEALLPKKEEGK